MDSPLDVGLYVHVAFCRTKCYYCDFNTYAGLGHLIDGYVDALEREIRHLPPSLPDSGDARAPFRIGSVFLGGGTPSLLSVGQVDRILAAGRQWPIDAAAEVTIEANPDDPTVDYLRDIRDIGVNRLSFGVQSFDDDMLQRLGRRHNAATSRRAYDRARQAGFDNVSLDLMFALPGQTLDQWMSTVDQAIELRPDHLSVYNLTVEDGTPFGTWAAAGKLSVPDEDLAADMYEGAIERLGTQGYVQYEISNWAHLDAGRDLRAHHNLRYWRNQPYFGVGAGAHASFAGYRYANVRSPAEYSRRARSGEGCIADVEKIGPALEMAETMLLGLRLSEGIGKADFTQRFDRCPDDVYGSILTELRDSSLISEDDDRIWLTYRGRMVGNEIFYRFLPPSDR